MNTKTTDPDAHIASADEQPKTSVWDLADQLLVSRSDDPDYGLELAFNELLRASDRLARRKALNGRTMDELSDEESDNIPMSASIAPVFRALVHDYGVKAVRKWVKEAGEDLDEDDDDE